MSMKYEVTILLLCLPTANVSILKFTSKSVTLQSLSNITNSVWQIWNNGQSTEAHAINCTKNHSILI